MASLLDLAQGYVSLVVLRFFFTSNAEMLHDLKPLLLELAIILCTGQMVIIGILSLIAILGLDDSTHGSQSCFDR